MAGIKDQENIDELRSRLYARNAEAVRVGRHDLTAKQTDSTVPRVWSDAARNTSAAQSPHTPRQDARVDMRAAAGSAERTEYAQSATAASTATAAEAVDTAMSTPPVKKRRYRWRIVGFSALIFVCGVIFSSFYIMFGLNEISGQNISIEVTAPGSIGAGETIPVDIVVQNQNPVPIRSVTLVVDYPSGTRSADEPTKVITGDRIAIEEIAAGEIKQIPVRAIVFGEAEDEKTIGVRLEYRVQGTNSTLERDLDPIVFQITSSPLVLQIDSIEKVAAGQEIDITVTVNSNAPAALGNVLVTAQYPSTFDFTEATPAPAFGQNTWQFAEIPSNGSTTIRITGVLTGGAEEESVMDFSVGVPRNDNQYILESVYATARSEFVIEEPFIDIELLANEKAGDSVVLESGARSEFIMRVTNTLDEPVYDMYATAQVSGNALNQDSMKVAGGFYDSNTDLVRFDVTTNDDLEEVRPGEKFTLRFTNQPERVPTGELEVSVNVFARRVSEGNAQEQLVGSKRIVAQYSSIIEGTAQTVHDEGPFSDSGPIPPVAGEKTTYTILLTAEAGVNDLTETTVTATLPTYVTWLDTYEGDGTMSINPVNQEITWDIGSLSAGTEATTAMQVALTPSRSQIDKTPVLLNTQYLRARDRYTGTIIRSDNKLITTTLENSSIRDSGEVLDEPLAEDEEN